MGSKLPNNGEKLRLTSMHLEDDTERRDLQFSQKTRCSIDFEQGREIEPNDHVHDHLKEVHLAGFYGTLSQIKFAIYLLKNAPALKRLVIDPKEKCGLVDSYQQLPKRERKNISLNEGERERVCEQMQEFSKDVGLSTSTRQEDIISELPTDVLSLILSYLTFSDAVKTSVLSHRWTRISASRLSLIFDRHNIMPIFGYPCMDYKHIFVGRVNQFLQFYEGTHIVSFQLRFCLGMDCANNIDQWISFANKMGAENTTICFDCGWKCLGPASGYKREEIYEYYSTLWAKHSLLLVPKLEEVYCQVSHEQSAHYIFHQLAKDLPNLRMLHVVTIVNWVSIPKSIAIFSKVETLELYFGRRMEFDVLKMTAILRAFPLLQKFYLQTTCSIDFEQGRELEPNDHVHEHLKEVHLAGFYGSSSQIKFAIYLLKNAPALKRLVIDPKEKCGLVDSYRQLPKRERKKRSWNEGERERVCEQMQEFSKDVLLII
nr:isoform 2 of f-box/lrr-repeat protein [Quercus suber]